MKLFKQARKYGAALAVSTAFGMSQAFAVVSTTVSDGMATTKTDVETIAGLAFLVSLVIYAYRKYNAAAK